MGYEVKFDLNKDGVIDMLDFGIFSVDCYGKSVKQFPGAAIGDFNGDLFVDDDDADIMLNYLKDNIGATGDPKGGGLSTWAKVGISAAVLLPFGILLLHREKKEKK
ncbi:MAG: hypothetical protein PHE15_05000 [Dehalococcoidales bacterium]|nr:hypothetical protein [Dehalococcoidales bacterium]